mmetsp:Transcript_51487/g.170592  ORF Transcript_51487/g.170592 Transcript_51487/m.170592 type:complete len:257 (+) Transcript_51487:59-829(+)
MGDSHKHMAAAQPTGTDSEVVLLYRRPEASTNLVQISGLSAKTSSHRVEALAAQCGPVSSAFMHQADGRRWANVQFYSRLDCDACLRTLHGCVLDHCRLEVRRHELANASAAAAPTPALHAVRLMNHFVGFAGWSSSILRVEKEYLRPDGAGWAAAYAASVEVQCGGARVAGECLATRRQEAATEALRSASRAAHLGALRAALAQIAIVRVRGQTVVEVIEDPRPDWSREDPRPATAHAAAPAAPPPSSSSPVLVD